MHSIQNYRDISSKVIILDGTADLSVEYEVYSDCLDIRPCDDYKRELSRLHICIYQGPTGKTRLQYNLELREKLLAKINEYQRNIYLQAKEQPVIFSYKMLKRISMPFVMSSITIGLEILEERTIIGRHKILFRLV